MRWVKGVIDSAGQSPVARPQRIVLIGPMLPFRGGIAQHTTMLYRALKQRCEILAISFSRQYPAWLFPGESDRDPDYVGYREAGVAYLIDSLNPVTWRRALKVIRRFAPQAVIIPWWTVYWAFCFHHIAAALKRLGVPVIFVCHNVVEHETIVWKRLLTSWVLATTDRFAVHTRQDRDNLLSVLPGARVLTHPLPVFDQFPTAIGALPPRAGLELLFFGFVRPYKGLDVLLGAMALIKDHDIMLTVAGEFWSDETAYRQQVERLGLSAMVEMQPGYHSEAATAELFARADVVVLPYRSATGSAIIPLAYHYGKPVIATRVGGLPDVVSPGRTGVLVAPDSPRAFADAITGISREKARAMGPAIQEFTRALSWGSLAEGIMTHASSCQLKSGGLGRRGSR